jgi:hypothetical protein
MFNKKKNSLEAPEKDFKQIRNTLLLKTRCVTQVDFDKTKHLSESMIKKRKEERERLIKEEADREEKEKTRSKLETLQKKEQM